MTANDRFDRSMSSWLRDDATFRVPDHLDEVLRITSATPQRPAWSSLERWLPVDTTFRPRFFNLPQPGRLVLVAALVIALLGLLVFAIGSRQQRLPPPFGPARNGILLSSGDGDIYAVDPVTAKSSVVIGGSDFDFGATFSRDGTKFMFLRGATGCGKHDCGLILMVANADGTAVRELTRGLQGLDWQDWSPDGTRIAILAQPSGSDGHVIKVVNVDGSGIRTLDVGRPAHEISWLPPDGAEIVFRGEQPSADDPPPGIFAVRPDDQRVRPLTTRPATDADDYQNVGVSADGSAVTYSAGGDFFQVHILSLQTGEDRVLPHPARDAQFGAAFSPDGRMIAYVRFYPDGFVQLVVAPTDGSGMGIAVGPRVRLAQGGESINNYTWSPDGTAILANYDADKTARLVPIDGSPPIELTQGELALPAYQRLAP
jgi:Tol biopolymer transport system component